MMSPCISTMLATSICGTPATLLRIASWIAGVSITRQRSASFSMRASFSGVTMLSSTRSAARTVCPACSARVVERLTAMRCHSAMSDWRSRHSSAAAPSTVSSASTPPTASTSRPCSEVTCRERISGVTVMAPARAGMLVRGGHRPFHGSAAR